MFVMNKLQEVFKIIEQERDETDFTGPVTDEMIKKAEDILEIRFPPSYRSFLSNYGSGGVLGLEFYGVISNPDTDGEGIPNAVWYTKSLRTDGLESDYIAISDSGYGPIYVIDSKSINEFGESPVFLWDVNSQIEKVADNFGEFLFNSISEMME